jgi:hypothetical protein
VYRGYPVPWFVTWFKDGQPCPAGDGEPDFRVITIEKIGQAVLQRRCWVCGDWLGRNLSFVIGPMCAVNRNTAEPPCHRDCANWSARACPFLTRPHAHRRDAGLPAEIDPEQPNTAGIMLTRNPGVALVWTTRSYEIHRDPHGGVLFEVGTPDDVRWWAEGQPATREAVQQSIDTGLPALEAIAAEHDELDALAQAVAEAQELLPA